MACAGAGAAVPPVIPARPRAAAPSLSLGTSIVEPMTTLEAGESPFAAASVRVVRLLAAAIDHSVSPGSTVCGTEASAQAAEASSRVVAASAARRTVDRPI